MTQSIMIQCLDTKYTAEYIANVLWEKDIAKVGFITLIPQIINYQILNTAYINIASYAETETAYEFVVRIKNEKIEVMHDYNEVSWFVEKNTHNSGDICVGPYTTKFCDSFFKVTIDDEDDIVMAEEEECPIRDMHGQSYTVMQAKKYVEWLTNCTDEIDKKIRDQELDYLVNELRIHDSVIKSQHVTIREKRNNMPRASEWCYEEKESSVYAN